MQKVPDPTTDVQRITQNERSINLVDSLGYVRIRMSYMYSTAETDMFLEKDPYQPFIPIYSPISTKELASSFVPVNE